jgi:ABC-2 type transport system permease protein
MRKPLRVILAFVRRELADYFSTPTGYVFISLFVFLSAVAAFWQEQFFTNNLANLDPLNRFFPYLLVFFIPAISMSLFSEERKQGTEELLLTLPASDTQVVLGKYFAGVIIYTVALIFSLSHVIVLSWLGQPDFGLLVATYTGYWVTGSALLAVAMLGSLLTENLTVAFILGGVLCGIPVFSAQSEAISRGAFQRVTTNLSAVEQLRDAVAGTITPHFIVYFGGITLVALYLNVGLLGRRRWPTGPKAPRFGIHYALRALGLVVAMGSLTILSSQSRWRWDATSEKIHSLSKDTVTLLHSLKPEEPVFITAYFSPEVPRSYIDARNGLSAMLREFEAVGGDAVQARVVETVKYSPEAREAEERYNIRPYKLPPGEEAGSINEIFLGLVFTRGAEEFVISFFDRGLPAEYELMRSIRVVSRAKRKKIGVLDTPVKLFGDFDFQSRRQNQEWSIVAELKKQYEVAQVSADSDYPQDLDVLIAAQPSALTQPQADRLTDYVKSGKPAFLMMDPMPAFNLALAPQDVQQNASLLPFQAPPPSTKADLSALLEAAGVTWATDAISWDSHNPHPQFKNLPKEFVFVGKGFNGTDPVTAGLQEAVLLYPGTLKARSRNAGTAKFTPLLEAGVDSGTVRFNDLVQRGIFGEVSINPDIKHTPEKTKPVLAARIKGSVNAVIVADVDMMSEQFFDLRRRGIENLNFDNVTFLLNAVDDLAGDSAFIELRKRRPKHRTLEAVEARTRTYETQRLDQMRQAEATAETRLKEAQARLDKAVKEIEERKDLDEEAKQVMMANVQGIENRRLQVARTTIEDEKQRQIETSRGDMENAVRTIQSTIRVMAVVLPPVPAVLLFIIVSLRRLARERRGVPVDRLVEEKRL